MIKFRGASRHAVKTKYSINWALSDRQRTQHKATVRESLTKGVWRVELKLRDNLPLVTLCEVMR